METYRRDKEGETLKGGRREDKMVDVHENERQKSVKEGKQCG